MGLRFDSFFWCLHEPNFVNYFHHKPHVSLLLFLSFLPLQHKGNIGFIGYSQILTETRIQNIPLILKTKYYD